MVGRLRMSHERDAWLVLAHIVEPGDAAVARLITEFGPAGLLDRIRSHGTGLRHGDGLAARAEGVSAASALEAAARVGARLVTRVDREWPTQLDALGGFAPLALWVRGAADLRLLALRSVAIVGARACTPYGEEVARSWSARLAGESWTILSGAAFGIDAAAHRGALSAGGTTIAVLAGGVDVPYPRAHESLIARIVDEGAVVSETPPGQSVRRQRFLSRNRLIAALSRATVVVEAAERSGTAATARAAMQMSRPVLAVPGPVTSPASAGCHRLIREGEAALVCDVPDVLSMLDLAHRVTRSDGTLGGVAEARRRDRDSLAPRERTVLDALPTRGAAGLAEMMRSAGLAASDVMASLSILVSGGWVGETEDGWQLKRAPRA